MNQINFILKYFVHLKIVHKLTPSILNDIERVLNNRPMSRQQSKTETQKTNNNNNNNNTNNTANN